MSRPQPTLGYVSRMAACEALTAQGMTPRDIARAISTGEGIEFDVGTVYSFLNKAKKRRGPVKHRSVEIEVATLERLAPHAFRRGLSIRELVRQMIETIVDDEMVDAVMDDGATETRSLRDARAPSNRSA